MSLRNAFLSFITLLLVETVHAQCDFTPTIVPNEVILCPNEGTTLSTQEYDAYQWYKDGAPITGATGQTLEVSQNNDAGSMFAVAATLDGCTKMSAGLLVDGWMFLMPYVIHGGDDPVSIGPFGEQTFCEGQIITLTLSPGFTENITWTNNGIPMNGEHGTTLTITSSGTYSVSAAPTVCPNSVMGIGVEVEVIFMPMVRPQIVMAGDQLCVQPTGNSTQWYLDGTPAGNTDCITPTADGPYTAFVDYGEPCQELSAPWIATGIAASMHETPSIGLLPGQGRLTIQWPVHLGGEWMLLDLVGRPVRSGLIPTSGTTNLSTADLPDGIYLLASPNGAWMPVRALVGH